MTARLLAGEELKSAEKGELGLDECPEGWGFEGRHDLAY